MFNNNSLIAGWKYYFILSIVMGLLTIFKGYIAQTLNQFFGTTVNVEKIILSANIIMLLITPTMVIFYRTIDKLLGEPPSLLFMHPLDYWHLTHSTSYYRQQHFHRKQHHR